MSWNYYESMFDFKYSLKGSQGHIELSVLHFKNCYSFVTKNKGLVIIHTHAHTIKR